MHAYIDTNTKSIVTNFDFRINLLVLKIHKSDVIPNNFKKINKKSHIHIYIDKF